jgi:hypothetical protein
MKAQRESRYIALLYSFCNVGAIWGQVVNIIPRRYTLESGTVPVVENAGWAQSGRLRKITLPPGLSKTSV